MSLLLAVLAALVGTVLAGPAHAAVTVPDTPTPGWGVNGRVYTTLVVGDTLYVGGTFSAAVSPSGATVARSNLAAFTLSTGALLTTWQADTNRMVRALASDGTSLWAGGDFTSIAGTSRSRLARLSLTTGAVSTGFSLSLNSGVRALELDGSNLFVGGYFTTAGGQSRARLAKVTAATGAVNPAFKADADGPVLGLQKVATSSTLYVAGDFATLGGSARAGIGAVDATTGALSSRTFANARQPLLGLAISDDGSQVFGALGGGGNSARAWSTSTGAQQWSHTPNGDVQAIDYYDGTVYFGFHEGYHRDQTLKMLAVSAGGGALQLQLLPRFNGFWGIFAIDAGPFGVVVGGEFTQVSGQSVSNFARFLTSGATTQPVATTVLDATSTWRYWDKGTRPTNWQTSTFNDSAWATGKGQFGYGDGDETTVIGYGPSATDRYVTSYYRVTFNLTAIPKYVSLKLVLDDGAVVFVNGTTAFRDNLPDTGVVDGSTLALTSRSGSSETQVRDFSLTPAMLKVGANTIAVELHQSSAGDSDASFAAGSLTVYN